MALPGVMSALDRDVAMTHECFENLPLLAPKKLAKAIAHPPTGCWGYRFSGGSSKSAKVCQAKSVVAYYSVWPVFCPTADG